MVVALTVIPANASALGLPTLWDGTNPFNCTIQNAGLGTTVPDPGADPYCVSFDKTQQNITQLGILQFLLNEPARVAAAVPKCFYFQEDHWRGSIIQSDPRTVLYEFTGHYFFNKATGDGGAWISGFSVAGVTLGTGGAITHDNIPVDPHCAALAKQRQVYAAGAGQP
jgi:hypothetical protein